MGKASGQNMASQVAKQSLHGIKNGSVKKDKKPKFKNTPTGKVAMVDNMKGQNKNMNPRKKSQKNTGVKNNQDTPKEKLKQFEEKENSPKGKQNSPKGKRNIPKEKQTTNKSQKNQGNKKTNFTQKKELEVDDSESDSDINEGIIPQEEISMMDEASEDEEGSDTDVPDILGASLAEDSDVDDEDFEDEEEDQDEQKDEEEEDEESEEDDDDDDDDDDDSDVSNEEEMVEHKIIQMFKGVKSNAKDQSLEVSDDDDDDDDDEEDEDDDDEDVDMDKMDTSVLENDEDEDEDEDDDEDDDDDEEEDEKVAPGLKALLGKSMIDDDDDEDFNEDDEDDEDDDISDEEEDEDDNVVKGVQGKAAKTSNGKDASKKNKQIEGKPLSSEEQEEIDKRTIFVDNIPTETKAAALKKVFSQYGSINNMRFRNIVPKNLKIPKKVAAITQDIHPKAVSVVTYINYKSEESAKKALCMNGKKFEGNYLNVRITAKSEQPKYDKKKAIFIGNLKFGMNPNLIWELFGKCGDIESVRLIRDQSTGQTRGFGYVNFKSEDAVALALKLDDTVVNNRPIRVRLCRDKSEKPQSPKNQGKGEKRFFSNKSNDNRPSKKFKKNSQKAVAHPTGDEGKVKQKKPQRDNESSEGKVSKSFQGQKADIKNKKGSKFDKKKKEMAGKLTAKPKKQKA